MKQLVMLSFLMFCGNIFAQNDTLVTPQNSFDKTYNHSAALVIGSIWNSGTMHQPMGAFGKNVKSQFEISPEGENVFQLSQRQAKTAVKLSLAGLGLMLGALPIAKSGMQYGTQVPTQTYVGLGMLVSGEVSAITSFSYLIKSSRNMDYAIWLRNQDAIAAELPTPMAQKFRAIYAQETMYLRGRKIIKNGKKMSYFDDNLDKEFQYSADSWQLYKKADFNRKMSNGLTVIGSAAFVSSFFTNRQNTFAMLYLGGFASTLSATIFSSKANIGLRQAIFIRNRDVVRQRLMFE